jgi:hypothetical protein
MDDGFHLPSSDWFVSSDRVVSLRARPSRTWGFSEEWLYVLVCVDLECWLQSIGAGFVLLDG